MSKSFVIKYFIIGFILQFVLSNLSWSLGYSPNVIMCFAIVPMYLLAERYDFFIGGIISMAIMDIIYGSLLMSNTIALFLLCIIGIFLRMFANFESYIYIGVASLINTGLFTLLQWSVWKIMRGTYSLGFAMGGIKLQFLWNLIICLLLYRIIMKEVKKAGKNRYMRWH